MPAEKLCACLEDHVLPFIRDKRLPEDTLVMVFEEDFRWFPDDLEENKEAISVVSQSAAEPTAAGSRSLPVAGLQPKSKPNPGRAKANWWEIKEYGRHSDESLPPGVPQEVADCVRYSILAHRNNSGEFIWLGYNSLGKRKTFISSGTAFIMLTKSGAEAMEKAMWKGDLQRGPIDVTFKAWLLDGPPNMQQEVGFSYLVPPMGGFRAHDSSISVEAGGKTAKFQENFWDRAQSCVGTRISDDPKKRQKHLCRLTKSGTATYVTEVNVEEGEKEDLKWMSFEWHREPTAQGQSQSWSLPPSGSGWHQSSSSSSHWQGAAWQTGQPVSKAAPTSHPRAQQESWSTARQAPERRQATGREKRLRRMRKQHDSFRNWADTFWEALLLFV